VISQNNVELGYRVFDAFNRRDLDGFLALMDEDVEAISRLAAVEGGYHGHEGIRRWWNTLLGAIPDYAMEADIREVGDTGDLTFVVLRNRGHGGTSAAPVDETLFVLARWRDRKCVWWKASQEEADALEAAG
jgi:ketosteroid isomerase-like protein